MMNFETVAIGNNAPDIYMATNSIKPVVIRPMDESAFFLDMPEGDLYLDFKIMSQFFETFDDAVRWAETRVGVKFNTEDF